MNNKFPQISVVFDRRKSASATIKSPVEIRVTHNYVQKYINTGIKLYSTQWKKGMIYNCDDILEVSKLLEKTVADVRKVIYDMIEENNINLSTIPKRINRLHCTQVDFLDFCSRRASVRKYGKSVDSQKRYDRFLKYFAQWGKIKEFSDITDTNIIAYDKYLQKQGMVPYSKWNNYHRFLNSFILDAIDEGLLQRNPYKWINIDKGSDSKGLEKYLSPEELEKIKHSKMPTESLSKVRDTFVFQTYTCLSYSDLKKFNPNNICEIKGMKVYTGTRKKTSKPFTIPLLIPAVEILEKYNYKLPLISNVKYNKYIKDVARASGIKKAISTHWARHTGATLLLNEGVDMKVVARICGHSSTKITEKIYAKLLDETVVEAIKNTSI